MAADLGVSAALTGGATAGGVYGSAGAGLPIAGELGAAPPPFGGGDAIGFEFTGAESGGSQGSGYGAAISIASTLLAPRGARPLLAPKAGHETQVVNAALARHMIGMVRTGFVFAYYAERNTAEAYGKVGSSASSSGTRSRNRTAVDVGPKFGPVNFLGGNAQWSPGMLAPPGASSGSVSLYVGLLAEGTGFEFHGVWFGDAWVPGLIDASGQAFTPTADTDDRKWSTGYYGTREENGRVRDQTDSGGGETLRGYEPGVLFQPMLFVAFGDGTVESNRDGAFGSMARALTGPRLYNPEGTSRPRFSFDELDRGRTHKLAGADSRTETVSFQRFVQNALSDVDYMLRDWPGVVRAGLHTGPEAHISYLNAGTAAMAQPPKWDEEHTLEGVGCMAVTGCSWHQEPGPGLPVGTEALTSAKTTWPGQDEPAYTDNAAAWRYWWYVKVRGIDPARICMDCFRESFALADDWIQLPHVVLGDARSDLIMEATFGVGWRDVTTDVDRAEAVRLWNLAYAGVRNGHIRYPVCGMFESVGPGAVEALEGAFDDATLGRAYESGGMVHFRFGRRREAVWTATEEDLAGPPQLTLRTIASETYDAYDTEIPYNRERRYAQYDRRWYVNGALGDEDVRQVGQPPQSAMVVNAQHMARLMDIKARREAPDLIRGSFQFLADIPDLERWRTRAGDVIEFGMDSIGLSSRRWEVGQVSVNHATGIVSITMAEEPPGLWDDQVIGGHRLPHGVDWRSPYADASLRDEDLGAPVPYIQPAVPLSPGGMCPNRDYGYPGQRVRIGGVLWERERNDRWPDAGEGGVVWSINDDDFLYQHRFSNSNRIAGFFREKDSFIDSRWIKDGHADVEVDRVIVAIRGSSTPARNNRLTVALFLQSPRGGNRPADDFTDALEDNLALLFRRQDGKTLAIDMSALDSTPTMQPYNAVIPFGDAAGLNGRAALFFNLPYYTGEDYVRIGDRELFDFAIVDKRLRCPEEIDNPWHVVPEPFEADAGGPYAGRVTHVRHTVQAGFLGSIPVDRRVDAMIELVGNGIGGSGRYSYAWEVDGNVAQEGIDYTQRTVQVQFEEPGRYRATLEVTDTATGRTSFDHADILISGVADPRLTVDITADMDNVQPGDAVQLTALVGGTEASVPPAPTLAWELLRTDDMDAGRGTFGDPADLPVLTATGSPVTFTTLAGRHANPYISCTATKTLPDGSTRTATDYHEIQVASPELMVDIALVQPDGAPFQNWAEPSLDPARANWEATVRATPMNTRGTVSYAWTKADAEVGIVSGTEDDAEVRLTSPTGGPVVLDLIVTTSTGQRWEGEFTVPEFLDATPLRADMAGDSIWLLDQHAVADTATAAYHADLRIENVANAIGAVSYAWAGGNAGPHPRDLPRGEVLLFPSGSTCSVRFLATAANLRPPSMTEISCNVTDSRPRREQEITPERTLAAYGTEALALELASDGWTHGGLGVWHFDVTATVTNAVGTGRISWTDPAGLIPSPIAGGRRYTLTERPTQAHTVRAEARDEGGRTATADPLTVAAPPPAMTLSLSASTWSFDQTAGEWRATVTATPTNAVGRVTYQWVHDGVGTGTGAVRTLTSAGRPTEDIVVNCEAMDTGTRPTGDPTKSVRERVTIDRLEEARPLEVEQIAPGMWRVISGTRGQAGAVWEARPTVQVSGGTGTYAHRWANRYIINEDRDAVSPRIQFTATASQLLPPRSGVSVTVTSGSESVTRGISYIPAVTDAVPQLQASLEVLNGWQLRRLDTGVIGAPGTEYIALFAIRISGGVPPYMRTFSSEDAAITFSLAGYVHFTATADRLYPGDVRISMTVRDSATPPGEVTAHTTISETFTRPAPPAGDLAVSVAANDWANVFGVWFTNASATITGASPSATINWSVASPARITSGQGTSAVTIVSHAAPTAATRVTCTVTDGADRASDFADIDAPGG